MVVPRHDPVSLSLASGERLPIRWFGYKPTTKPGSPLPLVPLPEQTRGIVIHLVPHHIVGRPGQLMAHCLYGDDPVCLGHLLLIVVPYRLVEPPGKLCSLDVSPREVLVPVLPVAVADDLAGRGPDAFDTAAVRGVVTHGGEATDIPHLEHDREGEDLADTGQGDEPGELLFDFQFLEDHRFYSRYLLFQMADETEARQDRGLHLCIGKEPLDLGGFQLFYLFTFHPHPEIAGEDVLDAQDV